MSAIYSIRYLGVEQSLEHWGVEGAVVTFAIGGGDSLSFTVMEELGSALRFAALSGIELNGPNGQRIFRGVVLRPTRMASGSEGRIVRRYFCSSLNYWLGKVFAKQDWKFFDLLEDEEPADITDEGDLTDVPHTTNILGRKTTKEEVGAIVTTLRAAGAPIELDDDEIPEERTPEDKQRSLTCGAAIERCVLWQPHMGWRWNYQGAHGSDVTMEFFSMLRSAQATAYGLEASPFPSLTVSALAVERFDADPRYDLLERQVKVHILYRFDVDLGGGEKTYRFHKLDAWPVSPASNGAAGCFEMELELRAATFDGTDFDEGEEPIPNLAKRLAAAYVQLWHDITFEKKGETCDFAFAPGVLVSVSDGDAEYAGAEAVIHEVTHDLDTGTTRVKAGPPDKFGLPERMIKAARNRNVPSASDVGGQDYGFEAPDDGIGGGAPFELIKVDDTHIRVVAGTVNGVLPAGFEEGDEPPFIIDLEDLTSGVVYVEVNWNFTSEAISSVQVLCAETLPEDDDGTYYTTLGTFGMPEGVRTVSTTIGQSLFFGLCGEIEPEWGT